MNNKKKGVVAILAGLFSVSCMAQGDDDAQGFVYSTYHVCDQATQSQMDDVVERFDKPVLDAAVADGRMTGWGYYSHFTGGEWRRLQYHTASSMEAALNNQGSVFTEIYQGNPVAGRARSNACATHDDYVWAVINGSAPGDNGTAANSSLSVYYVCDFTREEEADEMVANTFAPVLNQMVEDGELSSWGWLAHRIGGKYRRLQTLIGASHADVIAARNSLLEQTGGQAAGGFGEICGSHTDYLWNVVH